MSNITAAQIEAFKAEAAMYGDYDGVKLADRALRGSKVSARRIAAILAEAAEMAA